MSYVHHIPGRLRVRSAAVKRNESNAAAVGRLLRAVPGVEGVEANTLTGSVVIRYNSTLTGPPALMQLLSVRGYLSPAAQLPAPTSPALRLHHQVPNEAGSEIARKVAQFVVETAVERSVVALVAALL